ncbi:MAG: helix-turn-helix transcriptional regulator [Eubacteriales bacterium]|nr:helix-turn-helix transcriptional regulator [Eubacteriales bacterium]
MPTIRDNLKALRISNGLSQNEVADAINVTRQTVSSYETGRMEPDLETLKRLAEVYNADIHDVLYGSNRKLRKMKYLRWIAFGISAVLLLSLLIHSTLFLVSNTVFVIRAGTRVTQENRTLIETRFALRDVADTVARIGVRIFSIGCLVLVYPLITMRKICPPKKVILWLLGLIVSMFITTVPFMLSDKIYGYATYFLPVLNVLPCIILIFLVSVVQICLSKK